MNTKALEIYSVSISYDDGFPGFRGIAWSLLSVDIYGACGSLKCPRSNAHQCFQMLDSDYKFYLAFENSNCRDYITEKFFVNGLG